MNIALVAYGGDSNGTGSSSFCGFVQPIGIANGDLVIVALALPAANVTVRPPDSSWTQIAQTDATQSLGLQVWATTALNLPSDIVFALSSSVAVSGVLVAYRNSDPFQPVEASVATLTAASTSHAVGSISAAQNGEEALLFIAGKASGTYTSATGWVEVARGQRAGCTIEAQHKPLQNAGTIAGFSETFSTSAAGASVIITLAPSASTQTYDDVYRRLLDALPKGIDRILDFTVGAGDFYFYFWCIGAILKLGFDLVDIAWQEIIPFQTRYKLPDWERLFALSRTRIAQLGTIPQRQQQVIGAWRTAAGQGSSIPAVQAAIGPLLGYLPTTLPQVIEANHTALRVLHSYQITVGLGGGDLSISNNATGTAPFYVNDGGIVANMGAQLFMNVGLTSPNLAVTLTGPDGTTDSWTATAGPFVKLCSQKFAGKQIQGVWQLSVTNTSGSVVVISGSGFLYVEGTQRGQQTGGAVYEWGVYADPAHLAENGSAANFDIARATIKKMAQSHTVGNLIQSLTPYPDTDTGLHAAIPDECIPT